jgi:phospholipase/lecithinase/hemolysin
MLVFGDSLSDVGNAHGQWGDEAFPCPPHWRGRRCDGPLWVERLAASLGLPEPRPSLAGGDVHACGGARSGAGFSPGRGAPNLLEQVARWRAGRGEAPVAPPTLAVLRAGANDYLDAPGRAVAERVNANLLTAVERLADAGLRRFLVPSELPWGCSPIELPGVGPAERAALNAAIAAQNDALGEALRALAERRGLQVAQPDFHGLLLKVRAQPAAHGFHEIERPALLEPLRSHAAPDAAGVLWWDGWGHFTSAFHGLLAAEAAESLGRMA